MKQPTHLDYLHLGSLWWRWVSCCWLCWPSLTLRVPPSWVWSTWAPITGRPPSAMSACCPCPSPRSTTCKVWNTWTQTTNVSHKHSKCSTKCSGWLRLSAKTALHLSEESAAPSNKHLAIRFKLGQNRVLCQGEATQLPGGFVLCNQEPTQPPPRSSDLIVVKRAFLIINNP